MLSEVKSKLGLDSLQDLADRQDRSLPRVLGLSPVVGWAGIPAWAGPARLDCGKAWKQPIS